MSFFPQTGIDFGLCIIKYLDSNNIYITRCVAPSVSLQLKLSVELKMSHGSLKQVTGVFAIAYCKNGMGRASEIEGKGIL